MPKIFTRINYIFPLIGLIVFSLTSTLFTSCTSSRTITYFQNKDVLEDKQYANLARIEEIPKRIQPDDILAIVVNSLSEESNAIFNTANTTLIQTSRFPGSVSTSQGQPLGYSVDQNGEINFPLAGKVRLAGMTLNEANVFLKEIVTQYIKDPSVDIRLLNHKFTVIGEVNRPGIYNLLNRQTTLPDVIGIAGDLTLFGQRNNVMLIRSVNSKREVIKLDLTSRQILNSPYYFIENNDVIYVASRPGRLTGSDRTLQLIPIVVTIITTSLLLYNNFLR
ncbi:polysaccharide biosynthesis/export family protein [Larkinella ripae]